MVKKIVVVILLLVVVTLIVAYLMTKPGGDIDKDFDYFIARTKKDGIDFKILQGTRSLILK